MIPLNALKKISGINATTTTHLFLQKWVLLLAFYASSSIFATPYLCSLNTFGLRSQQYRAAPQTFSWIAAEGKDFAQTIPLGSLSISLNIQNEYRSIEVYNAQGLRLTGVQVLDGLPLQAQIPSQNQILVCYPDPQNIEMEEIPQNSYQNMKVMEWNSNPGFKNYPYSSGSSELTNSELKKSKSSSKQNLNEDL